MSPACPAVLPLDLPAARAILDEGQYGPGKMLCAQWVLVQGGPAAKGGLAAALGTCVVGVGWSSMRG